MKAISQEKLVISKLLVCSLVVAISGCEGSEKKVLKECAEATIAVASTLKEVMLYQDDPDPLKLRQQPTQTMKNQWVEANAAAKRWQDQACEKKTSSAR